jgi:hypothetical protein
MRILMIHGRAQGGKDPVALQASWIDSLRRGFAAAQRPWPEDVVFDFPYYADRLDAIVAGAGRPVSVEAVAKGAAVDDDYARFLRSALEEIRAGAAIGEDEVRAGLDPDVPQEKGPQNWWWVRAIARAIDRRLTPMAGFTIEAFLRDVHLYLRDPEAAAAVDALIDADTTDGPTLVVGHSLGSVVAYRLLQRRRATLRIAGFVTVGSPLGLRAVAARLPAIENPPGAERWHNAYDRRDIVALNPLDDAHFPADPPVVNHGDVDNRTANRHGIVGYLDDPWVAARIADGIARMRGEH